MQDRQSEINDLRMRLEEAEMDLVRAQVEMEVSVCLLFLLYLLYHPSSKMACFTVSIHLFFTFSFLLLTFYFLFFFSDVIFCCYMLCFMLYNCIYIYVDRKG